VGEERRGALGTTLSSRRSSSKVSVSPGGSVGRKPTIRSFVTDDNQLLYHLWILVCGLTLVVPLCVGIIQRFPLSFAYEPPGLGIVSATTLRNFPVQQESYYYVLALTVLMLGPGVLWLTWIAFSLSLARVLGRDFGTVATRGCWAWLLFPLVFPYALLRPEVTFALLVPSALAVPLLQVFLVLALPQTVDRELGRPSALGALQRWWPLSRIKPSRKLACFFVLAVTGSWVLFLGLTGWGGDRGTVVTLITLLTLAVPVLFLAEWLVLDRWLTYAHAPQLAGAQPARLGTRGSLGLLLMDVAGIALTAYLFFVVKHPKVMLTVAALVAGLLVKAVAAERLARTGKAVRVLAAAGAGLIVVAAFAVVTFDTDLLHAPPSLNAWFLHEDGAHLAWANAILHGEVQGRDFYSMYGPLLHYGLVGAMKVVGVVAEAAPLYWWLGQVAGAVAAVLLLWELTGNGLYAVLGLLVLHTGVGWRTAFALAALAAFTRSGRTRRVRWALLAGLLTGVALAISQELGLCVLLACLAGTAVLAWRYETRKFAGEAFGLLLVGGALSLAPLVLHLFFAGALGDTVRDLVAHPRYAMMGYGNLPFPNLFPVLAEGRPVWALVSEMVGGGRLRWYFPIMAWVVTLQLVTFRYAMGKAGARDLGALMVMVFGVFAFRVVLGRSDGVHLHLIMPVVLVLFLWQFCLLLGRLKAVLARNSFRVVNVAEFAALSVGLAFLFDAATLRGARVAVLWEECGEGGRALGELGAFLRTPSQLDRAVVRRGRASVVADVVHYVQEHTASGSPILAVPNIPVFYFLADRPNPQRFDQMGQLVTNAHRVEAYRDLERRPPRLVLYHGGDNNIDGIPPSRQFPNILSFILGRYERTAKFGPIYVLAPRAERGMAAPSLAWRNAQELSHWQALGDAERVGTDARGTFVISPGDQVLTLTATLEDIPGGAYGSLRFAWATQTGGTLSLTWRTREPLDTEEKPEPTLALPPIGAGVGAAELDLRDYPSWLFNQIRELSVTIAAPLQLTVHSIELVPAGFGPQSSTAPLSSEPTAPGREAVNR